MKKFSLGLLAAVVIAFATAPAEAAKKKKSDKSKKDKAEVAKVEAHPMQITCFLNGLAGVKQSKGCGG